MSTHSEKAARIAELRAAVDAWATQRTAQIEAHIAAAKRVRKARGELVEKAALAAESLVAEEISEFLA